MGLSPNLVSSSAYRLSSSPRDETSWLWTAAWAASWAPRGLDSKYLSATDAETSTTPPSNLTWRCNGVQTKVAAAWGFASSSALFLLLPLAAVFAQALEKGWEAYLAALGRWLDPRKHTLIHFVAREQGLIARPGSRIRGVHDLARPGVRFINRQMNVSVAAAVADGRADAGFGLRAEATRLKLAFVPLAVERYFFACAKSALRGAALAFIRVRDRWEDVYRSLAQLVLGCWMIWQARRLRVCERHFAAAERER